jgi:hypothetical protein
MEQIRNKAMKSKTKKIGPAIKSQQNRTKQEQKKAANKEQRRAAQ